MAKIVDISALKPADLALAFKRSNAIPLDSTSLFDSLSKAQAYAASGAVSYAGQVISVVEGGVVTIYKINTDGSLSALGADSSSDLSSLGERVGEVESAIEILNGDEETEGSVAASIKAAIDALPADLVVKSGEVVTNPDGKDAGVYIKLVLSSDDVVYVPADALVDTYSGDDLYIDVQNYKISLNMSKVKEALGLSEDDEIAVKSDLEGLVSEDDIKDFASKSDVEAAQSTADEAKEIAEGNATAVSNLDALLNGDEENDGLIDRVSAVEDAVSGESGIAARLDDVESVLAGVTSVSELAANISTNASEISSIKAGITGIEARLDALEEVGAEANVIESVVVNGITADIENKVASVSLDAADIKLNAAISETYPVTSTVQSVLNDMDSRIATINSSVEAALEGGVTSINSGVAISVSTATADNASKTAPKVGLKIAQNSAISVNESNELDLFWIEG